MKVAKIDKKGGFPFYKLLQFVAKIGNRLLSGWGGFVMPTKLCGEESHKRSSTQKHDSDRREAGGLQKKSTDANFFWEFEEG